MMKPHDGGACPVEPESIVRVSYRNGKISEPIKAKARRWQRWQAAPRESDWDIVGYEFAGTSVL
ncbi:hypothetical protein WP12_03380 [Sphingomonas sp. SRS2]|nr:hypothetical protein WP12_03380 [Sphingomonas sp. SRS2]